MWSRVFVSVRADQDTDPLRARRPLIIDSVAGGGPIVGIRSALAAHPHAAWLVLACDLPFLSDAALAHLLAERDPSLVATAYRSAHDGLPEPLCAVWEPKAADALAAHQAEGGSCPRKFLMHRAVKIIEPLDRQALDNVNTPEEYAQALRLLDSRCRGQSHAAQNSVLRLDARAGRPLRGNDRNLGAATAADLYSELQARYGFTLSREQLKVAVNSEFSTWSRQLVSGDAVVFIPPVAGG